MDSIETRTQTWKPTDLLPRARPDTPHTAEDVVLASPLSFTGSAKRIWHLTANWPTGWQLWAARTVAVVLIAIAWTFIALVWYPLCLLFLLPFLIWRFHRRSVRREKRAVQEHRELVAAIARRDTPKGA